MTTRLQYLSTLYERMMDPTHDTEYDDFEAFGEQALTCMPYLLKLAVSALENSPDDTACQWLKGTQP